MAQALTEADVAQLFPEIADIKDAGLRSNVAGIWIDIAMEMAWTDLMQVPKNLRDERGRSLVQHVRGVTRMAVALCEIAKDIYGRDYDKDMLLAACLLHDASKPVECEPSAKGEPPTNGIPAAQKSHLGKCIQHGVYAAHKVLERGMGVDLAHLLITHTHQSNTRGTTWEAAALFYADFADTDVGLSAVNATMYIQKWKT